MANFNLIIGGANLMLSVVLFAKSGFGAGIPNLFVGALCITYGILGRK